jgi:hypothetical protein
MFSLNFNRAVFFILLVLSINIFADECEALKYQILEQKNTSPENLEKLNKGIQTEKHCFKNLMGVMLYEGIYFPKDVNRSEEIFYDLSNKNYPESQFNFAFLLTQRANIPPEKVIPLLFGIYATYLFDHENSHLASKSRILLEQYVVTLRNEKTKRSLSESEINAIDLKIHESLTKYNIDYAAKKLQIVIENKERTDAIMAFIGIGLIAYNLSSIGNSPSPRAGVAPSGPNPWFNYGQGFGNPLNLYQFGL